MAEINNMRYELQRTCNDSDKCGEVVYEWMGGKYARIVWDAW